MKIYQTLSDGETLFFENRISIPKGSRQYRIALKEVEEGKAVINPALGISKADALNQITGIYEAFLQSFLAKYTNAERLSFHTKSNAAKAMLNGEATSEQKVYLAKLAGVLNGVIFKNKQSIEEEFDKIENSDPSAITSKAQFDQAASEKANKIIERETMLNFVSAEAERLRDIYLIEIENSEDRQSDIDSFSASIRSLMSEFVR